MFDRRRFLTTAALGAGAAALGPAALARLVPTPPQTRGPFYPAHLPLDRDNDLVVVQGQSGIARGTVTQLYGRVLDERGRPVRAARVEIWQCNAYGRYHHPWDRGDRPLDPNFQGYGQFVTDPEGAYRFRTIRPVAYPGRAPHIHFAITGEDFSPLTTQMYVAGAPENAEDLILSRIVDPKVRDSVVVEFRSIGEGQLEARFDIVLSRGGPFRRG